ncbi:hypothetical protein [Jiella sp. M17.18]|uniref:hypothetical protein n=1 Tax=Jiella sp. M17.18 TaxID=3234247 RepID=UPI0034DEA379
MTIAFLAGCTTEDRYTAGGAGIGGLGGAAIGAAVAGNSTEGALVGGALGAGVGAVVGNAIGRNKQGQPLCRYSDGNVYRCPRGYR